MKIYKFDNNTEIKCEDINHRTTKVNTAQNTYSINIPDVKNKTGQYSKLFLFLSRYAFKCIHAF